MTARSLVGALSVEQLQAALAHEFAHVVRSRRPLLIAVYLLRIVMFFNPVVLVAFLVFFRLLAPRRERASRTRSPAPAPA